MTSTGSLPACTSAISLVSVYENDTSAQQVSTYAAATSDPSLRSLSMSSSAVETHTFQPIMLSEVLWSVLDTDMEIPQTSGTQSTVQEQLGELYSQKIEAILHMLNFVLQGMLPSKEAESIYQKTLIKIKKIIDASADQCNKQKAEVITYVAKEALNATIRRSTTPLPFSSVFSACLNFPSLASLNSSKSQCATPTANSSHVFQFSAPRTEPHTTDSSQVVPRAKTPTPPVISLFKKVQCCNILGNIVIMAIQNLSEIYANAQIKLENSCKSNRS